MAVPISTAECTCGTATPRWQWTGYEDRQAVGSGGGEILRAVEVRYPFNKLDV
jgi:hypothetical protein